MNLFSTKTKRKNSIKSDKLLKNCDKTGKANNRIKIGTISDKTM